MTDTGDWDEAFTQRLATACEARDRAFAELGDVDPNVMRASIESGPPYWPTGRAYQHVVGPDRFMICTYGLSNPSPEPGAPPLGVELMIEVAPDQATAPWVFHTITAVAEGVIRPGQDFRGRLDHFGTLSNEVAGDPFPDEWRSAEGRVGILMGATPAGIPRSFDGIDGDVRLVPITILRPAELAAIIDRDEARDEVAAAMSAMPRGHACRLDRPPLSLAEAYEVTPYQSPVEAAAPRKPWWKFWGG